MKQTKFKRRKAYRLNHNEKVIFLVRHPFDKKIDTVWELDFGDGTLLSYTKKEHPSSSNKEQEESEKP